MGAGKDLTLVSSGLLELIDCIMQNGAVPFSSAGGTAVLDIQNNNVNGSPLVAEEGEAGLLANHTFEDGAWTTFQKVVLEAGKKITAVATGEDFTSAGTADIYLIFRRLTMNATIAPA